MEHFSIFGNWLACVDYAIVFGGALFFTHKRYQEHCDTAGLGRLSLSFFGTLAAMALITSAVGLVLFKVLLSIVSSQNPGMGIAFLFVLFGPAACMFIGAACALVAGSYSSRLFWKKRHIESDGIEDRA